MSQSGIFTVTGINFPDGADPMGIWQIPAIQATSYTVDASRTSQTFESSQTSVWRVQLPEELEEADAIMESYLSRIDEQQRYLDDIDAQLGAMDPIVPIHTSFDSGSYDPRTVLLNAIGVLSQPFESFNAGDAVVDHKGLYDRCEAIFNRFRHIITRRGRIETSIGDNLIGLTKIEWNGDFETIWETLAPPLAMHIHVKSIRLASASRMAILRILSIVGTGALSLAIKASIPGGQFLLIPAVYKFVNDMLEEFRKIPVGS
jgi:hypothetical protein